METLIGMQVIIRLHGGWHRRSVTIEADLDRLAKHSEYFAAVASDSNRQPDIDLHMKGSLMYSYEECILLMHLAPDCRSLALALKLESLHGALNLLQASSHLKCQTLKVECIAYLSRCTASSDSADRQLIRSVFEGLNIPLKDMDPKAGICNSNSFKEAVEELLVSGEGNHNYSSVVELWNALKRTSEEELSRADSYLTTAWRMLKQKNNQDQMLLLTMVLMDLEVFSRVADELASTQDWLHCPADASFKNLHFRVVHRFVALMHDGSIVTNSRDRTCFIYHFLRQHKLDTIPRKIKLLLVDMVRALPVKNQSELMAVHGCLRNCL